jgi:Mce-associated membrane protein
MTRGRPAAARAAVAVALVFCAFGGWTYAQAEGDESLAHAASRDTALAEGKERVETLTSFDAERPEAGLRRWLDAATGPLREELKRTKTKGGPTTRAEVTDAALTALDDRTGTAELIATVEVATVTAQQAGGTAPDTRRKRLEATLARTADGWKVQSLAAVPVGGV